MSYESIILEKVPFAYWPLDEAVGTAAADILAANNGTYVNGPTLNVQPGPISREPDGWTTFNGSSQYVNCGVLGALGSSMANGITIEAWLKSAITNAIMAPCGTMRTAGGLSAAILRVNANSSSALLAGGIRFAISDLDGPTVLSGGVNSNTGITDGSIHHLVVTAMPSTNVITIYVDGVSQTVTYQTQATPNNFENWVQPFYVGANNAFGTPAQYFNGSIGRAAIYNRILSQAEVTANYLAGLNGTPDKRLLMER